MKSTGLPIVVRLADRPVMLIGDGEAAEAKRRLLERAGARIVGKDEAAALAIVVEEDDRAAEQLAAELRARGMLVNMVDRPELCDFTLPAIIDREPLLVAVATGGASAGLAAAVRQRLETLLPARLGSLAEELRNARGQLRHRYPEADARRRALSAALASGGPLDPLQAHAPGTVRRWLETLSTGVAADLVVLTLRSREPEDLTLRQARLLGSADRLFHRADVPSDILSRARADAARIVCDSPPAQPGEGLSLYLEMAE